MIHAPIGRAMRQNNLALVLASLESSLRMRGFAQLAVHVPGQRRSYFQSAQEDVNGVRHRTRAKPQKRSRGSVKRSTNRILTTHVGSLPRPADLLAMNDAKASGRAIDQTVWSARVKAAIWEGVRQRQESGVDIVNDGELSKSSWSSYVNERLGGFAESVSRGQGSLARGRDKKAYQEFYDEYDRIQPFRTVNGSRWTDVVCHEPIVYKGQTAVQIDRKSVV